MFSFKKSAFSFISTAVKIVLGRLFLKTQGVRDGRERENEKSKGGAAGLVLTAIWLATGGAGLATTGSRMTFGHGK